jgi:hypothetical protein
VKEGCRENNYLCSTSPAKEKLHNANHCLERPHKEQRKNEPKNGNKFEGRLVTKSKGIVDCGAEKGTLSGKCELEGNVRFYSAENLPSYEVRMGDDVDQSAPDGVSVFDMIMNECSKSWMEDDDIQL